MKSVQYVSGPEVHHARHALAKQHFPGQRTLFALVLVMLMIPVVATFVPLFVMVNFGLAITFGGPVLPFLAQPLAARADRGQVRLFSATSSRARRDRPQGTATEGVTQ